MYGQRYCTETWTLTSDLMKQLEATEMWFLRRMLQRQGDK